MNTRRTLYAASEEEEGNSRKNQGILPKIPLLPGLTIPILSVRLFRAHGGAASTSTLLPMEFLPQRRSLWQWEVTYWMEEKCNG